MWGLHASTADKASHVVMLDYTLSLLAQTSQGLISLIRVLASGCQCLAVWPWQITYLVWVSQYENDKVVLKPRFSNCVSRTLEVQGLVGIALTHL